MLWPYCRNPTLRRVWGWDSHSWMGTWESIKTLEISKFNCRGQNTSHWDIFYITGKLSKRRCWKWACMNHLEIFSTSYGKKKVKNQTVSLTPDHQKLGIDPTSRRASGVRHVIGKLSTRATSLLQTSSQSEVWAKNYDSTQWWESKPGQFRDSLGVPG